MSFSNNLLLRRFEDLVTPDEQVQAAAADLRGRIVLAESDPVELEHIAAILRNLDFTVYSAGDGESALGMIKENSPVLVLSSLRLPKLDGYKLCQVLRESKETEGTPFMFIVDDGELPDHLIGHESYAHDYIQKPISVSELKNRIQSLLNLVGARKSSSRLNPELEISVDRSEIRSQLERRAQALELTERIRTLLNELVSCLKELEEVILTGEELELSDTEVSSFGLQPIDSAPLSDDWIPQDVAGEARDVQAEERLPEHQAGRSFPGSVSREKEACDGVEDIFAEFFAMEQASRSPVQEPREIAEETSMPDEPSDQIARAKPSERLVSNPDQIEDQPLYEKAVAYVLDSLRDAVSKEALDIFRGALLAETIVDSLNEGSDLVRVATDREQEYAVSRHSVNVAIFATRIAQTLGLEQQRQREVCLAALLHELGVGALPAKLIHKEGSLTSEELKLIRRRPIQSGEIISALGQEYVWLAEIVKQVAERENGTGNPSGLVGEEIDERAKIIGIADVFDACIHRRPYRDSVSGYQALFELTTDQQRVFSDQMVKALIRSFSLYPFNECVRLSTGEVGKVVDINPENLSRPVVAVLFDREGAEVIDRKTIDLGRESSLYIAEALAGRNCPTTQLS